MRLLHTLIIALSLVVAIARGSDATERRLFDLTTETSMPHLEENLRYATTTRRQCLTLSQLTASFPILQHPALDGCKLQNETQGPENLSYQLACTGGHGTTGAATWHLGEHAIRGTLDVRLGGKNMTFFQRITAIPLGRCLS